MTVSDSQATASTSFLLTVTAVNDLPTISALANQTTSAGTAVGPLALTVGDVETAAGSLTLTGDTTNSTLVPVANIAFGGTGANRTVTVTPAPNQTGTATITVTVSDSQATASTSFLLTVTGSNTAPTISAMAAQTVPEDTGTGALAVTVGDAETAAGSLTLTGGHDQFDPRPRRQHRLRRHRREPHGHRHPGPEPERHRHDYRDRQ